MAKSFPAVLGVIVDSICCEFVLSALKMHSNVKLQVFLTVVNPSVVNGTQWVKFVKLFSCCIFFFFKLSHAP